MRVAMGVISANRANYRAGTRSQATTGEYSLARRLMREAGRIAGMTAATATAVARTALAADEYARRMNRFQGNVPRNLAMPISYALDYRAEAYHYRVRIESDDVNGIRRSVVMDVFTNEQLTQQQLQAQVMAHVDFSTYGDQRRARRVWQRAQTQATAVTVVSAGRRP